MPKSKMKSAEYRRLCREIHREFGKSLEMGFWESCELAELVSFGESSKERLFENLREAAAEMELGRKYEEIHGHWPASLEEFESVAEFASA